MVSAALMAVIRRSCMINAGMFTLERLKAVRTVARWDTDLFSSINFERNFYSSMCNSKNFMYICILDIKILWQQ